MNMKSKKYVSIFLIMLMTTMMMTSIVISDEEMTIHSIELFKGNDVTIPKEDYQTKTLMQRNNDIFYAWDSAGGTIQEGPFYFNSSDPMDATSLASDTTTVYAGTWAEDTWYIINEDAKSLLSVNNSTGATTLIGTTSIPSSYITTGLTYDPTIGVMYASAGEVVGSTLYTHMYTINMTTGASNYLGQLTSDPHAMIWIACNKSGNMYGADIIDDELYEINVASLTVTSIGPLGIDLNYAQGGAFDKDNDILYLAAYTTSGSLYTCNTSTGAVTLIGGFPDGDEICALAIPYVYDIGPQPQDVMITSVKQDWNLVSIPFNESVPKANITINYAGSNYSWADAVTNGYVNNFIFGWDRNSQTYGFADTFVPGEGYWLYATVDCTLWIDNITIIPDETVTSIKQDWNLMSVPNMLNVDKTNLTVNYAGSDYSWADAVTNGYVNNFIFGWDRNSQTYGFADTFVPGEGYWLYATVDCILKQPIA